RVRPGSRTWTSVPPADSFIVPLGFSLVLKRLMGARNAVNRFEIACDYAFGRSPSTWQSAAMRSPPNRHVTVFFGGSFRLRRSNPVRWRMRQACRADHGLRQRLGR